MRYLHLIPLLFLAGCSSNYNDIVRDVCVPLNAEGSPTLEDLAKAKGYDIEDARSTCRDYVLEQVKEVEENMRKLGVN